MHRYVYALRTHAHTAEIEIIMASTPNNGTPPDPPSPKTIKKSRQENAAARILALFSRRDLPQGPRPQKKHFRKSDRPTSQHFSKKSTSYAAPGQSTKTKMTAIWFSSHELFDKIDGLHCILQCVWQRFTKIKLFHFPKDKWYLRVDPKQSFYMMLCYKLLGAGLSNLGTWAWVPGYLGDDGKSWIISYWELGWAIWETGPGYPGTWATRGNPELWAIGSWAEQSGYVGLGTWAPGRRRKILNYKLLGAGLSNLGTWGWVPGYLGDDEKSWIISYLELGWAIWVPGPGYLGTWATMENPEL